MPTNLLPGYKNIQPRNLFAEQNDHQESVPDHEQFRRYFERNLDPLAAGFSQSLANSGASIVNFLPNLFGQEDVITPHDFQKNLPENASGLSYGIGRIGGSLVGPGAAFSGLSKIPQASGLAGILQKALQGGLSLGATSEYEPGGRVLGSALGGGLGAAGGAIGSLKSGKYGLENIFNKIGEGSNLAEKKYSELYPEFFKKTEELVKAKPPKFKAKALLKDIDNPDSSIFKYSEKPSIENAHYARSEASKHIRSLEKSKEINAGSFSKNKELREAKNLKKQLDGYLEDALTFNKDNSLLKEYQDLNKGFQQEVVPYRHKPISQYKNKKLYPRQAFDAIKNDREILEGIFNNKGQKISPGLAELHPELKFRTSLEDMLPFAKKALNVGTPSGAVGLGGYYALKDKK